MATTYTAITIGPIYEVLNRSKRSRMTWAGSYFFSYMIRELAFSYLPRVIKDWDAKRIIPAKEIKDPNETLGAGIYPDRILFATVEGDFEKVQGAIDQLIAKVASDIQRHIDGTKWGFSGKNRSVSVPQVESYLKGFVKLYYLELPIDPPAADLASLQQESNVLLSLYPRLEVLELRNKHLEDGNLDFLHHFLFRVNKLKGKKTSFLAKDAFGEGKKRFDSLMEVSTRGLSRLKDYSTDATPQSVLEGLGLTLGDQRLNDPYQQFVYSMITQYQEMEDENLHLNRVAEEDSEEAQAQFLTALKKYYGVHFRNYHKYVAVIYADGDGIGQLLREIGHFPHQLKAFSEKLIDFNIAAAKMVKSYGASPIYLGGEDLLLFAPVACLSEGEGETSQSLKTVFDLVQTVDAMFDDLFVDVCKETGIKPPTLSWGIAIGYYKHPLNNILNQAHECLKAAKDDKHNKNSIAFRVESHSGQHYHATIEKYQKDSYDFIQQLIKDLVKEPGNPGADEDMKFVSGIAHRLKNPLFSELMVLAAKHETWSAFIDNHFNEPIHRMPRVKRYLEELKKFLEKAYTDYAHDQERAKEIVYATLRFIHFVNAKDETE